MLLHGFIKRAVLLFAVPLFLLLPLLASAEEVGNYDVDITINDDASFSVVETVEYDFGAMDRHGFYRSILHRHPQDATAWYKERSIDLEVTSVSRDGGAERFVVSDDGDQTTIKIGKAESTINGKHVYQIAYTVRGGLSYLEDGKVELYWNATGNGWQVPLQNVTATVGPAAKLGEDNTCYRGLVYSTTLCNRGERSEEGITFTVNNLNPYEGLTVAVALDPESVPVGINEHIKLVLIIAPLITLLIGWYVRFVYRFKTFYRPGNRTIVPQYEPYNDLLPMFSGVLMDRRLDGRDVTAGLLYLAQSGFIKIKKIERTILGFIELDDYEVTLLKNIDLVDDTVLPSNFHRTILSLIFTVMSEGVSIKLSDIKKDQSRLRKNYAALTILRRSVVEDLIDRGFYERKYGMMRKTQKGYEAILHLKGFKRFLSVTDKERFTFHNAPQKSPEQFMEFLPYAVAFGVEEEWAKVFKDMEIDQPDWYEGAPGSFSAASIGNELSSFATAANAASGSGYTSSSSASGGGGFSGGGGGGGGGGSW